MKKQNNTSMYIYQRKEGNLITENIYKNYGNLINEDTLIYKIR